MFVNNVLELSFNIYFILGLSELDISNNNELEAQGLELLLKVRRIYISLGFFLK